VIGIFLVPVSYYVVETLVHRGGKHEKPKAGGPADPGTPKKTGDGELPHPAPRPALSPIPVPEGGSYGGGH